jgi:hypothetical protein
MKDHVYLKLKARNDRLNSLMPIELFRSIQYHIELAEKNAPRVVNELTGKVENEYPTRGPILSMDVTLRPKSAVVFSKNHRKQHASKTSPMSKRHELKSSAVTEILPQNSANKNANEITGYSDETLPQEKNVEIVEEEDHLEEAKESPKFNSNFSCMVSARDGEPEDTQPNNENGSRNENLENRLKNWHRELGVNKVFVTRLRDAEVRIYIFKC